MIPLLALQPNRSKVPYSPAMQKQRSSFFYLVKTQLYRKYNWRCIFYKSCIAIINRNLKVQTSNILTYTWKINFTMLLWYLKSPRSTGAPIKKKKSLWMREHFTVYLIWLFSFQCFGCLNLTYKLKRWNIYEYLSTVFSFKKVWDFAL